MQAKRLPLHPVRRVQSQSHVGKDKYRSYGVKLPSNTSYVLSWYNHTNIVAMNKLYFHKWCFRLSELIFAKSLEARHSNEFRSSRNFLVRTCLDSLAATGRPWQKRVARAETQASHRQPHGQRLRNRRHGRDKRINIF